MPRERDGVTETMPPIAEQIMCRTASLALPEDVAYLLAQVIDVDLAFLARRPSVVAVIPSIQRGFGGEGTTIAAFHAAWLLMYAAVGRLDHLQDGDTEDEQPALVGGQAAQYNAVLSTYVLATSLLDELTTVRPERVLRLQRFWADCMLRMAAGQQRDLAVTGIDTNRLSLEDYQQIALMKTGATFALAFGGTALLLTDDQHVADVLAVVGELYGALLQYADDALDATHQPNATATLPSMLQQAFGSTPLSQHAPTQFWSYLYPVYRTSAATALESVQPDLRDAVLDLFRRTFETKELE